MNRKTKQFVATLVLLGLIVLHGLAIPRSHLHTDISASNTDSSIQAVLRTRVAIDQRARPTR